MFTLGNGIEVNLGVAKFKTSEACAFSEVDLARAEAYADAAYEACIADPTNYFADPDQLTLDIQFLTLSNLTEESENSFMNDVETLARCEGTVTSRKQVLADINGETMSCTEVTTTSYEKDGDGNCVETVVTTDLDNCKPLKP